MENNDYMDRFGGISRLYGLEATELFQRSHICVIGIGGVGCWTVEALARLGIGELTLVDMDDVCINNSNRQLHAMDGEVGRPKVDVMGDRIKRINPHCKVNLINDFFMKSTAEEIMSTPYDYVVDCIDSVASKCYLLYYCRRNKIPIVSCGGAGGRANPMMVTVKDMSRAYKDPLLAKVRKTLRNEYNFPKNPKRRFKIPTVFSPEELIFPQPDGSVCKEKADSDGGLKLDCENGYGTATFIVGTFGFIAASLVAHKLLKQIDPDR